jgi:UDP-N-acetylglucosamine diphosphorylase/glucosamine-1-phosphate N-acetyltransferase
MNLILFDHNRAELLPLTFTRPVAELRVGILTLRQKWEQRTGLKASWLTAEYLSGRYPLALDADNLLVNGGVVATPEVVDAVMNLGRGEALLCAGNLLAWRTDANGISKALEGNLPTSGIGFAGELRQVLHPWHIFALNGPEILADHAFITRGRTSQPLSATNTVIGNGPIFLEEGAKVEASILNTTNGPIYLGRDSEVMEGCIIRGPFALCDHAQVKMGAKIYGPTTVGPASRVGGEVNNSVLQANSNKGHDGYLGNSVLGEWCNLGADTNNSNLKNNYDEVKVWSYVKEGFVRTGLQFCGLIMADHSKSGINTMFNTGTVVGVSANVFGSGFPRNFIPSFSWGGAAGLSTYELDKALATAERVMARRNVPLDHHEVNILTHVFELSKKFRA